MDNNTSLRDALLYDTLSRTVPDNESESYQQILNNLDNFIETVHHSAYGADLLQCERIGCSEIIMALKSRCSCGL